MSFEQTADFEVTADGVWLSDIDAVGDLTFDDVIDGGTEKITWSMNLPETFAHPALRRGRLVQVKAGMANVAAGIMSQPAINANDDGSATWTFTCDGLYKSGSGFAALDASGDTTTIPNTAIDRAILRGLKWHRPVSLSSVAFTDDDSTDAINKVSDLLDVWAQSVSKHWGVDPDGNVYAAAEPTTPTWYLDTAGRFGLADDNYASTVMVRYWNGTGFATATATDSTAADLYGTQEYIEDALDAGVLTSTKAQGLADGALAAGKARLGWTESLSPTRWELTTPGGTPAPLWMVKSGQMVRLHGVINEQGQPMPYVDFVIGATSYNATEDILTISPVGLVDRDMTSVLASAIGVAA